MKIVNINLKYINSCEVYLSLIFLKLKNNSKGSNNVKTYLII